MGDNRNSVILYIGIVGASLQLVAGFLGTPPDANAVHVILIWFYAAATAAMPIGAIVVFGAMLRGRLALGWVATLVGGVFLLWHVFALLLLTGADGWWPEVRFFVYVLSVEEISVDYQVLQIVLFGIVLVGSALGTGLGSGLGSELPRRAEVPPPH